MDEKHSAFNDICNKLESKITNWREYYVLFDEETDKEIMSNKACEEVIQTSKTCGRTTVTILCKPKYIVNITDEAGGSENKFSFPYFPSSMATFEAFLKKIVAKCSNWKENCEVVYKTANDKDDMKIDDDVSFKLVVDNWKDQSERSVLICVKPPVCILCFCFFVCVLVVLVFWCFGVLDLTTFMLFV